MIVLNAENIRKEYREKGQHNCTKALNGINLTVESGEFVGIMGPSGSGKTTLLNVLSGIDATYSGNVRISENDLRKMSTDKLALFRRQRMGIVFQEFNLLDSLTLGENIMLPMVLDGKAAEEVTARTEETMSLFGINEIMDKHPFQVSGGQQQRAAISRAVINKPDIVFADEPTGNLDSKSSRGVMQCFERMNREKGNTVLMVTHDPFAASYCSRVVFIKDGLIKMEITKKCDNKTFFDQIIESLAVLEGEQDDI